MKKIFFMAAFLIGTFAIVTAQNDRRVPPKVKVDAPTTQTKPGGKKPKTSASDRPGTGNYKKAPGRKRWTPRGRRHHARNANGTLRSRPTQQDKAPVGMKRPTKRTR